MNICPKCGAENSSTADFCSLCLYKFNTEEPKSQTDDMLALTKSTDSTPGQNSKEQELTQVSLIRELKKQVKDKIKNSNGIPDKIIWTDIITPAVIAATGAFLLTLAIPKDKPLIFVDNRSIGFILLVAITGGWVLASNYKPIDTKRLTSGFFIGVSSIFAGDILVFFSWLILYQSNQQIFTKYAVALEGIILPLLLSVAIALFDQYEKFDIKSFSFLGSLTIVGGFFAIIISKLIPFIHSFVLVGLFCWLILPFAKRYLPNFVKLPE